MTARDQLVGVLQVVAAKYVAARCRVSPAAVSMWASGKCTPNAKHRAELAASYGVRGEWPRGGVLRSPDIARSRT